MAEVKWIKICTDIFGDEKILLIENMPEADGIIVIWFKLLCLAGKQNNSGVFMLNDRIAYTDEMLATIFRRPLNTIRLALETFKQFKMIEIIENTITIPNWEKYQSLDALETAREKTRRRVAAHREKQKQLIGGNACNVTVTPLDKNKIREDIEKDKESKKKASSRFIPPSLDEVKWYCIQRNNNVDAERFIDYYTSNGWKVGKNSMKDWKAAVRTWEKTSDAKPVKKPKSDGSEYADLI